MATVLSQLKTASFAGLSFPWEDCHVDFSYRHHVHIFLHTDGGAVEKLGRHLYRVRFTIPAHETLGASFRAFYSRTLPQLWRTIELGTTADLVVPSLGTMRAFVPDAKRVLQARVTSGERVELSFLEDQEALFSASALVQPSVESLPEQNAAVVELAAGAGVEVGVLAALSLAVDELVALRSTVDVYANVVQAKAQGVVYRCEQLRRHPAMGLAKNFKALLALVQLHYAVVLILKDAARRARPVARITTPDKTMSVVQISAWRYGTTARANEILLINAFPDPLAVPGGTEILYYRG